MVRLADVIAALDAAYDPATVEPWDAVGLVCGDPDADIRRVLFAVDPVAAVVGEALAWGADLVVTHHPLFLSGVHGVAATTAKGRVVHRLLTGGAALFVAHTNADRANPGVSDALAAACGLHDVRPLDPAPPESYDKLVVFVPVEDADALIDALADIGAGELGDYRRCAWTGDGTGTFEPLAGATPAIGSVGSRESVRESRVEMLVPRRQRAAAIAALRAAHPYEEPAFDVYELATPIETTTGTGRIGELAAPLALVDFTAAVAAALPATAAGVRAAGDPDAMIRTVAVCGGSGGSLTETARRAGADAYVTADLRHHPTSEALEDGALPGARELAVLDVTHWASEWPWLAVAAHRLEADLQSTAPATVVPGDADADGRYASAIETRVSHLVTDPWTVHVPSPPATT